MKQIKSSINVEWTHPDIYSSFFLGLGIHSDIVQCNM